MPLQKEFYPQSLRHQAAHEVGHFLIARDHGVHCELVSILQGVDYDPILRYAENTKWTVTSRFEVGLAGWAGKTYYLTHTATSADFSRSQFLSKIVRGSAGAGWPEGLIMGGQGDVAWMLRGGVKWWNLALPVKPLLRIVRKIHASRTNFFRLHKELLDRKALKNGEMERIIRDPT